MKITNIELLTYVNILNKYADKKLPQKISYAITKNIIGLESDFKCYSEELDKVLSHYKDYFQKDENGEIKVNDSQIPILTDKDKTKEMVDELNELLAIEIDIDLYTIAEDVFDYEDDKYDSLSGLEIFDLMSVLCNKEEKE